MKIKSIVIPLTLSIAAFAAELKTPPLDYRFIVSPFLVAEERKTFLGALGDHLERKAAPLTTVTVVDGIGLRVVGRATLPKLAYDSDLARSSHFDELFGELDDFFDTERYRKGPQRGLAGLRIPEAIEVSAGGAGPSTRIMIVGGAVYAEPHAQQLGFRSGDAYTVPSRSVFSQPASLHLFGTVGRLRLNGAVLWFWHTNAEPFQPSEQYKIILREFYSDYVRSLHGRLIGFSGDGVSLLAEMALPVPPVTQRIESALLTPPVPEPAPVPAPMPEKTAALVKKVRREFDGIDGETLVAILWETPGADFDLHHFVGGNKSVSYHNPTHQGIRYLGDIQSGGGGKWEIISYAARPPAESELFINLYSTSLFTSGGSRTGVLLVRHRGRDAAEKTFAIPTTRGDGGANVATRATDPNWIKLDLAAELHAP